MCNNVNISLKHSIGPRKQNNIYLTINAMIFKNRQNPAMILRFEVRMVITLGIKKCIVFRRCVTSAFLSAGKTLVLYVCGSCTGIPTLKKILSNLFFKKE